MQLTIEHFVLIYNEKEKNFLCNPIIDPQTNLRENWSVIKLYYDTKYDFSLYVPQANLRLYLRAHYYSKTKVQIKDGYKIYEEQLFEKGPAKDKYEIAKFITRVLNKRLSELKYSSEANLLAEKEKEKEKEKLHEIEIESDENWKGNDNLTHVHYKWLMRLLLFFKRIKLINRI